MEIKRKIHHIILFGFMALFVFLSPSFVYAQAQSERVESCGASDVPDPITVIIPGGTSTAPGGGQNAFAGLPKKQCCCPSGNRELIQRLTSQGWQSSTCPTECRTVKRVGGANGSPTDQNFLNAIRADLVPAPDPNDPSFRLSQTNTPLATMSEFVSRWYAAAFYIAIIAAVLQVFRGGFEYAIAAGNSSKTEEAKGIIIEAVIGLGVALLAAGILVFLRGPGVFLFN